MSAVTDLDDYDDFCGDDCSPRFFSGLQSNSETARRTQIKAISQSVLVWVLRSREDKQAADLLACHLPTVVRLSHECPFEDVRKSFGSLLEEVNANGISPPRPLRLGPSSFFSNDEIVPINSRDEQISRLLVDAFINSGRVSHAIQLMAYHPKYLTCFIRTHHFMMRCDGPLPFFWRSYIAVMAAARHRSSYLVNWAQSEFLMMDGPEEWLKGISYIPRKLRNLLELNKYLAHQPWFISPHQIEALLQPGPDSWSMGELVHALVLLAHWHALASFAFGCGLNAELDASDGHSCSTAGQSGLFAPKGSDSARSNSPNQIGIEQSNKQFVSNLVQSLMQFPSNDDDDNDPTEEEKLREFERIETDACQDAADTSAAFTCPECVSCFLEDANFEHCDFSQRGEFSGVSTFRIYECSWEDHGFSLLSRLYSDMGPLLDEKFSCVLSLTYNRIADKEGVDTTPFRQAVWNYIHCIKGIFHDDYAYADVNQLLAREFKAYIKAVTCYPEHITPSGFKKALHGFLPSERVHINLLLLEARFQAELLYALRALNRYITLRST